MKDSGVQWIDKIPEEWEITKCKYKVVINNGKEVETEEGDIPVYGTGGAFKTTNKYLFSGKSVLLGRKGTIDKPLYVDDKFWTVDTAFYTTMRSNMDVKLFYYLAICFDYKYYQTGSTVPSMTQTDLGNIYIPNISLLEQKAIADFLDDKVGQIDGILSDLNKQIDILNKYKKSLITETVTKGLDPNVKMKDSGIEWIGEIPEHWSLIKIRYFAYVRNEKGNYKKGDKYIGLENIESNTGRYIETESEYDENIYDKFYEGDLMFNKLRPYLAKTIIPDFDGFCTSELIVFKKVMGIKRYMYYFLFSDGFLKVVNASTYGAKMPRASWDYIKNLIITNPPIDEQQKIADYLDKKCAEIDSAISDKQKQIETMEKLKKSLIYEYVTGKKRVGGELRCQEISLESEKTFSSIL